MVMANTNYSWTNLPPTYEEDGETKYYTYTVSESAVPGYFVTYSEEGQECFIDDHMGFIKFGSRVDLYLPLDAEILVRMGQATVGDETLIAKLK